MHGMAPGNRDMGPRMQLTTSVIESCELLYVVTIHGRCMYIAYCTSVVQSSFAHCCGRPHPSAFPVCWSTRASCTFLATVMLQHLQIAVAMHIYCTLCMNHTDMLQHQAAQQLCSDSTTCTTPSLVCGRIDNSKQVSFENFACWVNSHAYGAGSFRLIQQLPKTPAATALILSHSLRRM
eukprot:jgi/Ulvmu1/2319/UM013_0167.1